MNLHKIFFVIVFVISFSFVNAQTGGRSLFSYTLTPISAKTMGTATALSTSSDADVSMAFVNPSLLNKGLNNHIAINYTKYYADINQCNLIYARNIKNIGTFSSGLLYANYGKFVEANESGEKIGEFSTNDVTYQIGWGRKLDSNFSIGSNIRFLYSDMYQYTAFAMAIDLSGSYINTKKQFAASLMIQNIGRTLKYYNNSNKEHVKPEIHLAFSKKLKHVPVRYAVMYKHIEKFDISYTNPYEPQVDALTGEPIKKNNFKEFTDKLVRHFAVGVELTPIKNIYFRLGYNFQTRKEMALSDKTSTVGLAWGIGVRVKKFYINYGRMKYHFASSPNQISISTSLGDLLKI